MTTVKTVTGLLFAALLLAAGSSRAAETAFNVTDFGAVADGKTDCTGALQQAIDRCAATGRGTVRVPAGTFCITPVFLKSGVTLQLDNGARLLAPGSYDKYPKLKYARGIKPSLISGAELTNVAVIGEGVIDGNCPAMEKGEGYQPRLLVLVGCKNVRLEGITLANSPNFHASIAGDDVVIDGVKFIARPKTPNAAGLGLSGRNIRIANCVFESGDDNIALGSTKYPVENVVIEKCRFGVGHGLSAGSYLQPGIRNVTIRDCTFEGTTAGLRLKTARDRGGIVENIIMSNVTMKAVAHPISINSYYGLKLHELDPNDKPQPVTKTTPLYRNIRITNLNATDAEIAGLVAGLPECPVTNLVFERVRISAKTGLRLMHVKETDLRDSTITVAQGRPLILENATVKNTSELDGAKTFDNQSRERIP